MNTYQCPTCGVPVPENELYADPDSGQPMHTAMTIAGHAGTLGTAAGSMRLECGPVSMTMIDKQRWQKGRDPAESHDA